MNFGLSEKDISYIIESMKRFPQIDKAVVFGSRAKGINKKASDIDIAIYGAGITFDVVSKLHSILEDESHMPYFFDIVDYTHLEHEALKQHINKIGKKIYEK